MTTVLAGGVGAARLLRGMICAVPAQEVTAIVNTADDVVLHGLSVSPDLDTVTYTLAEAINSDTGWGLVDETWQAMDTLERLGGSSWFRLGDRDLGTHLHRTGRLADGIGLAEITAEITRAWGIEARLLPMTEGHVSTMVTLADNNDVEEGSAGEEIGFQDYFVRLGHDVAVSAVRFAGIDNASPRLPQWSSLRLIRLSLLDPSSPCQALARR
jgi:LPPG:FO 2-phospho-L-lactate transferase